MGLFENGIEAIELGIEDYLASAEDERRASSAVRNFFAGVLLLFKERLHRADPEMVFARLVPRPHAGGGVAWVRQGPATVDVAAIQERWKSMGWSMDWKPLDRLQRLRNEVEHGAATHQAATLRKAISDTYLLVVELFDGHFDEALAQVLDRDLWDRVVSEAAIAHQLRTKSLEKLRCINGMGATAGLVLEAIEEATCAQCLSQTFFPNLDAYPETTLTCQACGDCTTAKDVVLEVVEQMSSADYRHIKDGGEPSWGECPSCDEHAFSIEEDVCLLCGEGRLYDRCQRCTETLALDEQMHEGFCGYCAHQHEKMMHE